LIEGLIWFFVDVLIALPWQWTTEKNTRNGYSPVVIVISCIIGLALGALSLLVFPRPVSHSVTWRVLGLILAPTLAGLLVFKLSGKWKATDVEISRIAEAMTGALFVFSFSLIRFLCAKG
jgi:hypothetical protein